METKNVTKIVQKSKAEKKKISPKFSSIKSTAPVNIERTGGGAQILPWCC